MKSKKIMLSHNQQDLYFHICIPVCMLSIQLISELLMLSPLVLIIFSVFMFVFFYLIPFLAFSQISIFLLQTSDWRKCAQEKRISRLCVQIHENLLILSSWQDWSFLSSLFRPSAKEWGCFLPSQASFMCDRAKLFYQCVICLCDCMRC